MKLFHFIVRRVLSAALVLLLAVMQGAWSERAAARGQRTAQPPPRNAPVARPLFDFRSGFWLNLHHFLYQQARLRRGVSTGNPGNAARAAAASLEGLTPEQLREWTAALDYYQGAIAERDLLFDDELVHVKNRLTEAESEAVLRRAGLPPELASALERAAPVYRAHWWAAHDRANRAWIADVTLLVERFGDALSRQLAAAYRVEWPAQPIRADVTYYANWAGAYTTLEPTHITISSTDEGTREQMGLETVFHEASHGLIRTVSREIERAARAQNKPVPRNLWHAVLFYTTGELVKRNLAARGVNDYVPYAYRRGLYERARGWRDYQRVMERHWQPYLEGRMDFEAAISRMIADLESPAP